MTIAFETFRTKTLNERMKLHQLIQSGMKEIDAINKIFPTTDGRGRRINSNRMGKLRLWIRKKLWPVTEQDLVDMAAVTSRLRTDRFDRLMEVVRIRHRPKAISSLEERAMKTSCNMSFRLPVDIVQRLKNLPGTRTEHVIAALKSYMAQES